MRVEVRRRTRTGMRCDYAIFGIIPRAQIHYIAEKNDVHVYSRNQEDNTSKYPDLIELIKNGQHVKKNSDGVLVGVEHSSVMPCRHYAVVHFGHRSRCVGHRETVHFAFSSAQHTQEKGNFLYCVVFFRIPYPSGCR